ncbi:hypothetical protein J422_05643 [Methanocaldococcus villosus KIN24-T80]|uniref:Anhydromevalonate phosphate decarboxylase n=1 Tax=Methanocaldococcus villosus KIN24-T80 TaxID=1069083 RepID=N6VRR4_9EURY|nr:UbiD family decarboxylase [Methanocaldococcus villosus]ENN95851.1 hypothetical protein J422_05643 [Methanocaldococcus villosus KIN24-T80]
MREFINLLNPITINKADKRYEVAKVLKKYDGKPVYIKDVDGYEILGNLWSRDSLSKFFNVEKEKFLFFMLKKLDDLKEPKIVKFSGYKKESPDFIHSLPIPIYYEKDPGPYITSGVVVAYDEDYGYNMSIHRMLVKEDHLVIRMVEQRHLYHYYHKAIKEKGYLDVYITIGNHPAVLLAASTSGDITFDELKFASSLSDVDVFSLDFLVPKAEIIIKAKILNELDDEGPFVDITGTYDKVRKQPIVEIEKIYVKDNFIFHALLPGGIEHKTLMGLPQEPRMFKYIRNTIPSVKNVRLTEGGCCWLHAIVQIEKKTEGDGKNAILSALASHPSLKHVVVVDDDINIFDINDIEYAIATRVQGDRDIVIIKGAKGSSLDPSSDGLTTKIGIDATKPLNCKEKFERII